jgi:hypothetical protein
MTLQRRPTGVTVLAILWVIAGVLWILSLLNQGGGFGLVSLGVAALLLAIGYGTWTLKSWAWTAGMAAAILNVFVGVSSLIRDSTQLVAAVPSIAISVLIIWYLNTPPVKAAFGRG